MVSMGLLIASRVHSEELADGLLNLLTWPMMFLSGVWFSLEGLHPILQKAAWLFPLTHIISASRAIMIDGASLMTQLPHVLYLAVLGAVCLFAGAWLFQWE